MRSAPEPTPGRFVTVMRELYAELDAEYGVVHPAPAKPKQRRVFECDYIYQLPDGTEWFRRRRFRLEPALPGKTKDITYGWVPKPNWWNPHKREGADRLLYHLPELISARDAGQPIWWTEGEKDTDNVRAAGQVATSHHGGAGNTHVEQAEWFAGHTGLVVLLMDNDPDDERGGNMGAYDVVRRVDLLVAAGLKLDQLRVGRAKVGKDVSDHLAAGLGLDELVWVSDLAPLRKKALRTRMSTLRAYRRGSGGVDVANWGRKIQPQEDD